MSARWLWLHVRARTGLTALAASAGPVAAVWALWLLFDDASTAGPKLVTVAVAFAVVPVTATLTGADDALERTAALRWPPRRAVHLLAAMAVAVGPLIATQATAFEFSPTAMIVRDAAGLLGLTALGAALFEPQRAWIAPIIWALSTAAFGTGSRSTGYQVVFWAVQPTDSRPATVTALALALCGATLYVVRGCPRKPATDPATIA